jgi:hypothetical protein
MQVPESAVSRQQPESELSELVSVLCGEKPVKVNRSRLLAHHQSRLKDTSLTPSQAAFHRYQVKVLRHARHPRPLPFWSWTEFCESVRNSDSFRPPPLT